MTTKQSSYSKPLKDLGIDSMNPPEPPSPPTFPTLQELALEAEIAARTPPTRRRLLDLFDGTLGDLAPLLADFSLHPEKYGADQTQLLEQLASGSISVERLNPSQRLVLNLAVLDFLKATPLEEPPTRKTKQAAAESEDLDADESYKNEEPETQPGESPETELPAHWWLQK